MFDQSMTQLAVNLSEVAIKNTAQTIYDKISAAKAKKDDKETINTLTEIINELINDKNELINISKCYEDKLVAQKISDDDITYIIEKIVPILGQFVKEESQLNAMKSLLSIETLKILQLLGFNYKDAIGEPLTNLIASYINLQTSKASNGNKHLNMNRK